MSIGRLAWLVGVALLVMVVNVGMSIVYMVVYSYIIDPGHEKAYYDAHVQNAAPYCSIVAGIPLMFLAGVWVAGFWDMKLGVQSALIVWLTYAVIDLAILAAAGLSFRIGVLAAVSLLTKIAAVYGGALVTNWRAG